MKTEQKISEPKAHLAEGKITQEALSEFSKRVGIELRIPNVYNTEVTQDAVRHFCEGIGDINPLYHDLEYARRTRYKGLIALPSWLYSVFPTWVLQGLPGVHAFHAGNQWEFYKPIRVGDKIKPKCFFTGFEEKKSEFAETTIMEYQEAQYFNQDDVLLAKAKVWIVRAERRAARDKGKYSHISLPHPWTEEELKKVEKDILAEEIKGAEPRYWENVLEGEELTPVVKGPLGLTDMVAYCAGASPVRLLAHRVALELYKKHPAWGFRDPITYAMEPVYSVHYNKAAANAAGLPYPYDVGVQRNSWFIQLFTNWMGDEAWLKRCYAEYREFVYLSDVVWIKGNVTRKYVDADGDYCVDISAHGINQRGKDTIPGWATVCLPSRKHNYWPLEKRL